jgi:hypothetical protein
LRRSDRDIAEILEERWEFESDLIEWRIRNALLSPQVGNSGSHNRGGAHRETIEERISSAGEFSKGGVEIGHFLAALTSNQKPEKAQIALVIQCKFSAVTNS